MILSAAISNTAPNNDVVCVLRATYPSTASNIKIRAMVPIAAVSMDMFLPNKVMIRNVRNNRTSVMMFAVRVFLLL